MQLTADDLFEVAEGKFLRLGPDDCWPWTAGLDRDGYGQITSPDRTTTYRAHRAVFEAMRGPIPEGKVLDHLCRTRECVNPAHLEVTTHRENILRGEGLAARNARKTHCKHGHPFTPENTYTYVNESYPHGRRVCKTCVCTRARKVSA